MTPPHLLVAQRIERMNSPLLATQFRTIWGETPSHALHRPPRLSLLPPPPLRPHRRRLQHGLRHSRLSRWRRAVEARAADDLSSVHARRGGAAALLGAQPRRLAALSRRAA